MREIHISTNNKNDLLRIVYEICTRGNIAIVSGLCCAQFNLSTKGFREIGYLVALGFPHDDIRITLSERLQTKRVPPQITPLTLNLHEAYMDLIDREAVKK